MQEEHGFLWRALIDPTDIDLAGLTFATFAEFPALLSPNRRIGMGGTTAAMGRVVSGAAGPAV
jgi:hypothetical protein